MRVFLLTLLTILTFSNSTLAGETSSPENAKVYFVNLQDGQVVSSPFKVVFGLENMGVAPAGAEGFENTGHHHLYIDSDLTDDDLEIGIPSDEQHLHFGKGQTETTLNLSQGTHTLKLVFGDANHLPHTPVVASDLITITVD